LKKVEELARSGKVLPPSVCGGRVKDIAVELVMEMKDRLEACPSFR
jgi:hypothetical protein